MRQQIKDTGNRIDTEVCVCVCVCNGGVAQVFPSLPSGRQTQDTNGGPEAGDGQISSRYTLAPLLCVAKDCCCFLLCFYRWHDFDYNRGIINSSWHLEAL